MRLLKIIPSHPCFTALCLIHCCLRTSLPRFQHLHVVRPLLSLENPSMSASTATLEARLCFGRCAGQSPLTNLALAEPTGASSFSPRESTHLENGPWVPDGRTRRNFNMTSSLIISSAVVAASTFSCSTR